jgi:hypothetical protein
MNDRAVHVLASHKPAEEECRFGNGVVFLRYRTKQ